jgi:uncharacterized protein
MSEIENREVAWEVLGLTVHGTITVPRHHAPGPGVVLVAGSGPTDRNWCSPLLPGTNGSGRLLAELLAGKGFVTLRYDKLGSGPSARDNASKLAGKVSMRSHLDELTGAVRTLVAEPNVQSGKLFALTNSEGALHATNYELGKSATHLQGLIFTGAPGRSVGAVAREQLADRGKGLPNLPQLLKLYDEAVDRFLAGKPAQPDPMLPDGVRLLIGSLENPANLPFARELWSYDLAAHIGEVERPMLVVIGKKDIQIDWKADGEALERATAARGLATFAYPANANHVLKHEEGRKEELSGPAAGARYNAEDSELDAECTGVLLQWLERESQ